MVKQILLTLAFLFFLGAVIGWVIELFFRRMFGDKKWVNPGFLKGPYLPIYGLGLDILFLLCRIDLSFIEYPWLRVVLLLVIMCVAMTGIEYIGGVIFIKGMKIKLWDYSRRFGNIQGIICPLFSFLWTAVGAFYYFLLDNFFYNSVEWLWNDNLPFLFVVGFFFGIFTVDLVNSTQLSLRLRKFATEHNVVLHYEKLKGSIQDGLKEMKGKISFLSPFRTQEKPLDEFLKRYLKKDKK
jgi:uncharacterized membrane protein